MMSFRVILILFSALGRLCSMIVVFPGYPSILGFYTDIGEYCPEDNIHHYQCNNPFII